MKYRVQAIIAVLFVSFASCSAVCKYLKFSPIHTYCKPPNPQCRLLGTGVEEEDKDLIVRVHNEYRDKVATGRETAAGGMPTAANMMEMVWDDELAAIAQKHAETCKFHHDCYACRQVDRFIVGQNIYMSMSYNYPEKSNWRQMIKAFYDEMYKAGRTCSACPSNTCCGSSCGRYGINSDYEGLCKVIDEDAFKK
uniref:BLTX589 n=1 Tax=Nephila pilipes TaxID=299642 RepID=A0A076L0I1_NEPPI|nr:BLTX589 [Nephila pilipes]